MTEPFARYAPGPLAPAEGAFLDALAAELPSDTLRPAEPRYLEEPRGFWKGRAGAVALPRDAAEVSVILRACNAARVGVVPYAGGTSLVGGQVLGEGPAPLVLSLERMRAIRSVQPSGNVMVAEAGAILTDVQAAAEAVDRLFPLSLGSQGSARIGGLLGTNAGGVNVLRYGNTRDLCLGLEAVLADGRIWHGLRRLRKDNTGYDLRNLLVGSEGTLGVITAASLRMYPRPARTGAAMLAVNGPEAALTLLGMAQEQLAEGISAFELISGQGVHFLREAGFGLREPFAEPPDWMVLIDLGLPRAIDPAQALETLFEAAFEAGLVSDGVIATSEAQRQDFWTLRETMPQANRRIGALSSHDIALPLETLPEFLCRASAALDRLGDFRINSFGHLGDGNLHYNVFPPKGATQASLLHLREVISETVYALVHDMDGSISAEHGIGRLKVADLERFGDPAKLGAMHAIKAALDPAGILNPGAVLRRGAG